MAPRVRRKRQRDGVGLGSAPSQAAGTIVVSTSTLTILTTQGSTAPQTETFTITQGAGGTLKGPTLSTSYNSGSGWLTTSVTNSTAGRIVTCSVLPGAAVPGDYVATVTVSDAADSTPEVVTVTMTVQAPPAVLGLSWASGDGYTTTAGTGVATPASRTVTVTNVGPANSGLIDPVVDDVSEAWMTITRSGSSPTWTFTLAPNSTLADLTGPARYNCDFSIVDANGAATNTVTGRVQVNVSGAAAVPILNSSVNGFSFTATQGGANPSNQAATLSNIAGSGSLAGPTATVAGGSWCTAVVSGAGPSYTLTVSAATGSLTGGTYTATITVADANTTNSIQLPVSFTVTPIAVTNPVLAVAPSPSPFAYTAGGALPAAQACTVTNVGTGSLAGPTATTNVAWLAVAIAASGTQAWTLTVTPTLAMQGLAAGGYSGTITVSDAAAAQAVTLGVALQVVASGAAVPYYNGTNLPLGDNQILWNPSTRRIEGRVVNKPPVSYYTGTVWNATTAAEFRTALASAQGKDIIQLVGGTQYTGPFTLPAGKTDWILIRTGDGSLYHATNRRTTTTGCAIIQTGGTNGSKCLDADTGAGYFHFQDVWIRLNPAGGFLQDALVNGNPKVNIGTVAAPNLVSTITGVADIPHHIGLERCYVDGGSQQTSGRYCRRGFGGYWRNFFLDNNTITGFADPNTDSQAIGLYSSQSGHIENNKLQGYSENVLLGGANECAGQPTNSDLLFRRNYFTNDKSWDNQQVYYGARKNIHEIKNARRTCWTENYGENSWVQGQVGWTSVWRATVCGTGQGTDNWCLDNLSLFNWWDSVGQPSSLGDQNTVTTTSLRVGRNQIVHNLFTNVGFLMPDGGSSGDCRPQATKPGGVKRASLDFQRMDHLTIVPISDAVANASPGCLSVGDLTPPVAADDLWPEVSYTNCIANYGGYGIIGRSGTADAQCAVFRAKGNVFYGTNASKNKYAGNLTKTTLAGALPNWASADYATLATGLANTGVDAATGNPDGSHPGCDVAWVQTLTANVIAGT